MSRRLLPLTLLLLAYPIRADLVYSDGASHTLTDPLIAPTLNANLLVDNGSALLYQNNAPPTGFAQILLGSASASGSLVWNYSLPDQNPADLSFGPTPIIANNGTFAINLTAPANATSASATFANPITVGRYLALSGNSLSPLAAATFVFSGPIALGGEMLVRRDPLANYWPYSSNFSVVLDGPITLNQSATSPLIIGMFPLAPDEHAAISGNILDDPDPSHTARQPLILYGAYDYSSSNTFTVTGTANSYTVGTRIDLGVVTLAPNSSLGVGSITVGGVLVLTSPNNLHSSQRVLLPYPASSGLALTFDQSPYDFIDPNSSGVLLLGVNFTTPLDESRLGNGHMAIGAFGNITYSAATLRPGSDHIYRFSATNGGSPPSSLTLPIPLLADYDGIPSSAELDSVTLAASNSYSGSTTVTGAVYVTAPGALGTGNLTVGSAPYITSYGLFLSAPNAYSSGAHVDVVGTLAAIGPNGTIPFSITPPVFHPGSALLLGDNTTFNSDRYPDSMPLMLNNSTLVLKGVGSTTESIGPLTISGVSVVVLWNSNAAPTTTILQSPSLTQDPHSVLFVIPYQSPTDPGTSAFDLRFSPGGEGEEG